MFTQNLGVEGLIKVRKIKVVDGERQVVSEGEWFNNLITNTGMNLLGESSWIDDSDFCVLGGGNTVPAITDEYLVNQIAESNTTARNYNSGGNKSFFDKDSKTYYTYSVQGWEFPQPTIPQNFTEVGFYSRLTRINPDKKLASRALIKDTSGVPTTISQQTDEILQIFYEFRMYSDLTVRTGTIVNDADKTKSHNYTITPSASSGATGSFVLGIPTLRHGSYYFFGGQYDEDEARLKDIIAGSNLSGINRVNHPYVTDSYERKTTIEFTTASFIQNRSGGYHPIQHIDISSLPSVYISFDPPIPKTNTSIAKFDVAISWTRRT